MSIRTIASSARCLAFSILAMLPMSLAAQQYPDQAAPIDPPGRVARLSVLQGEVSLEPAGVDSFSQAELNYPLTIGDRVYADLQALAELETAGLAVRMSNGADLTLTSLTDQVAQFGLAQGSIRVRTREINTPDGTPAVIEIDTPNGTIVVQAVGDIRIDSYPQNNSTVVTVTSGQVEVTGANLDEVLGPRESVQLTGVNPVSARFVGLLPPDALDRFDQAREGQFQNSAASADEYVSPDMVGAEDLSQYGVWTDDQSYGAVWYPSGVSVSWTPYHNGRWVYIAPWGWTWVESEPWGFAPFHYGRWGRFGGRWGWVPGPPRRIWGRPVRPVYSPALVAFVGGAGVTAWFPLGPGEAFVPWYRTSAVYVNRVNVTNIYSRNPAQMRAAYENRKANVFASDGRFANRDRGLTVVDQRDFERGRRIDRTEPPRFDGNRRQELSRAPVSMRPTAGPVAPAAGLPPARVAPASQMRPQLPNRAEFDRDRASEQRRRDDGRSQPAPSVPGAMNPPRTDPARTDSNRYDPARDQPSRNEPSRNEPARSEPGRYDQPRPAPASGTAPTASPARPAPYQPAPVQPAPAQPAPTNQPAQPENPPSRTFPGRTDPNAGNPARPVPEAPRASQPTPSAPATPVIAPTASPRQPDQRQVEEAPRQPYQRQPEQRQPDQRLPDQRQPDQRRPEQNQLEPGNRHQEPAPRQPDFTPRQPAVQPQPQTRPQETPQPATRPQAPPAAAPAPAPRPQPQQPPQQQQPRPVEPRRDTKDIPKV